MVTPEDHFQGYQEQSDAPRDTESIQADTQSVQQLFAKQSEEKKNKRCNDHRSHRQGAALDRRRQTRQADEDRGGSEWIDNNKKGGKR